jgi:predicted PurR-regulated permease PerM
MSKRPTGPPQRSARDHEHVATISTTTIIFVLVGIAIVLHTIQWILLPFLISGLLAYICTPVIAWLTARTSMPRALAASAVFVVLLVVAALVGSLGAAALAPEIIDVARNFQNITETLFRGLVGQQNIGLLGYSFDAKQLSEALTNAIAGWIKDSGGILVLGGVATAGVFGLFLTLVLLFYFLLAGPAIARGLLWLVPPGQRPLIQHIWSRLDPVLKRYFVGIVIVVAYATTAAYVGLGPVLGLPHAVFLALLTGILEMIPMIGPAAAIAIAGMIAVRHATGFGPIIAYAIYATLLRLSIDQLFGPLALGSAARLHPTLIIFCFLAGGFLFGVSGVILAVPVALTTKVTLTILYDDPSEEPPSPGEADEKY